MGGTTPLEGRVEVFLLGHWGTVCDYYWDHADATVVCNQLGFPRAVEARKNAAFGSGSGPSWYYRVYCTGTELSLNQCSRSTYHFGSACSHSNDAGVVCSSESHSTHICHLYMIELWLCVWVFSYTCVLCLEFWILCHGNGHLSEFQRIVMQYTHRHATQGDCM